MELTTDYSTVADCFFRPSRGRDCVRKIGKSEKTNPHKKATLFTEWLEELVNLCYAGCYVAVPIGEVVMQNAQPTVSD